MIVSVHVPKTAGRSFLAFLQETLGEARIRRDWSGGPRIEGGMGPVAGLLQDVRGRLVRVRNQLNGNAFDCIHGHFVASKYASLRAPMVAWVRDPVERVVSHHAFFQRYRDERNRHSLAVQHGLSLLDFAALPRMRNLQSRYLDAPLERFALIGRTEHFDEDLIRVAAALELPMRHSPRANANPGKSGAHYDLSAAARARILDLNRADAQLYDRVRDRFHA
jgi:hypothetical protein